VTTDTPPAMSDAADAGLRDPRVRPGDPHDLAMVDLVHPAGWPAKPEHDFYDLVVIGAGSAGLVSSAIAAELGARTLLIEGSMLGGDCLVAGCVPSKGLLRGAKAAAAARRLSEFGVHFDAEPRIEFREIMGRLREKRARIAHHDSAEEFKRRGVEIVFGRAHFTSRDSVEVGGTRVKFARAIVATGSRPRALPIEGLEEAGYLTNETVFSIDEQPGRLAVIGGGPIGCELGSAFARLDCSVTLIEAGERIMGPEDADAAAVIHETLEREGVRVITGATVERVETEDNVHRLTVKAGGDTTTVEVDKILVGAGRVATTEGLGLDAAGVSVDKSGVVVDDNLKTTNPRVFAAGDCCLKAKFTHTADASARIAVRNALFLGGDRASRMIIPRCTYTTPEVASVGDTKEGDGVGVLRVDLSSVDRAIVDGSEEGWLKVFHDEKSGRIRGAVLVGDHAGDMISIFTALMTRKGTLRDLSKTIFPYPTVGEVARMAGDEFELNRLGPLTRKAARWVLAVRRKLV